MKDFQPIPALSGTISDVESMISSTYHSKFVSGSKKDAFTLAETLITLAVIGVVAALTIPTLMQVYKDKQLETAKKKAMTTVGNGYKLMVAENDGASDDSLPLFKCGQDFSCLSEVHRKFFSVGQDKTKTHEGFAEKYTKSTGDDDATFSWDDVPYIFTTNDGMTYGFLARGNIFEIVVDVNGDKGPNKICEDVFKLGFDGSTVKESDISENPDTHEMENVSFCKALDDIDLAGGGGGGCSAGNLTACTADAVKALSDAEKTAIYNSLPIANWGDPGLKCLRIDEDNCLYMDIGYLEYPDDGIQNNCSYCD